MAALASGAKWGEPGKLAIAGVPSGAEEVLEWRWERGKAFRVGKGQYVWIAREKPWHTQVGGQWMTEGEVRASGLVVAQTDSYGETADGQISGSSTSYANARSTSSAAVTNASEQAVGQAKDGSDYTVYRLYFSFDTSAIDDAHEVLSAKFYAKAYGDMSDTDFEVKLYRYTWSEPLGDSREANYDGAYGGSATLEGTFRKTADGWASGTYYDVAVAIAGINKAGDTKYTMVSSRDVNGNQPSGNEYVYVEMADNTGTGDDPYLAITTQIPAFAAMF